MSTEPVTDDLPRHPSEYHPSTHFAERFDDRYEDDRPPRHLDGDIVAGCIEDGKAVQRSDGNVHFRNTFGGVTYRLVANPESRCVVTGYPIGINTEAARESGRWTSQQIEDLHEFIATNPADDPA